MKKLKNNTLVYDDQCPLCSGYTHYFIRSGMLDNQGRIAYSSLPDNISESIDTAKARNEIALINKETGKVVYGVESLLIVLGNNWPIVRKLGSIRPIHFLIKQLYFFISYNRKVISPAKQTQNSCIPDVNYFYRCCYLLLAWLITSFTLFAYANYFGTTIPSGSLYRELAISAIQIPFQLVVLLILRQPKKLAYHGNMMTVSVIGSLMLFPMLILNQWVMIPSLNLVYFFLVVAFMIYEHKRRVQLLEISPLLTLTWIIYRIFVLLLILFL